MAIIIARSRRREEGHGQDCCWPPPQDTNLFWRDCLPVALAHCSLWFWNGSGAQMTGNFDCWVGWLKAVYRMGGLCSFPMDKCAIFLCIFLAVYYSVYVATLCEAKSIEIFPFFPWHIFARRDTFHGGCECVYACFIQNYKYLFISVLQSQNSLRQCECPYTCVPMCVHMHDRSREGPGFWENNLWQTW